VSVIVQILRQLEERDRRNVTKTMCIHSTC